jgi:hypothetical protein
MAGEACPGAQTCAADGGGKANCITVAETCRGSDGQPVCDTQGALIVCNPDESIKLQTMCMSARHCQVGLKSLSCAMCIPKEEHRCSGTALEVCADDGMSFTKQQDCPTAALCNKTAGMCIAGACAPNKVSCDGNTLLTCNADGTAFKSMQPCAGGTCDAVGGDCNKCEPGSKKCDGGMVATCDAAGQTYAPSACPTGNHCVGLGQCVQCASNDDCSALTQDCKVGVCMQNKCTAQNQTNGMSCTASGKPGTCSNGACQCTPQCSGKECGDNGCGGTCPPGCSGGQMCVGNQCVDCQNDAQCASLNGSDGCVEGYCDAGSCKTRNAPSTKSCRGSGTCRSGSCCTPDCTNKCGVANGCGGTCPTTCPGGMTCSNGACCTPSCGTRCAGSNGCGGNCDLNNCSASGLICQAGECIPPPTIGGLYTSCDGSCANDSLMCTQIGPAGPFCFTKFPASGTCPTGLVGFLNTVCLAVCPGSDADKVSPGCPPGAKICYGASADTGYCVPSTSD